MFIRTEVLRIKWQSFPAQLTRKLKQPVEEESFNYFYKLLSNEARYIVEVKSRIVMPKATFKKFSPSPQVLEEETVMCYIWSITL
jgi:hypothetical protein